MHESRRPRLSPRVRARQLLKTLRPQFAMSLACLAAASSGAHAQHGKVDESYRPKTAIRPASDEARKAMKRFKLPPRSRIELFAAEPALANPVSFTVGPRGRIYVCETFRLHRGVTDNRSHGGSWLDEELACRTVEDRVAMYERKFKGTIDEWKQEHERVRVLEDRDGDGRADFDRVFADGFKQLADGIAAGILVRGKSVYYTCIPKLWKLDDVDGDGRAETKTPLHHGYGVHTSLLGHDLHGLIHGPDNKVYFSIGDRGFHIRHEGRVLSMPDEGAVFRCNLDGSELEVVHRGLRNPQELAFDDHGNLFTGDNNSDGGDKARWVYIVEGGNSGWHIGYQSIGDRGPWNREKMWHPQHEGQPAYIVPPIANVTNGPSGLLCDPGTGLASEFRGSFLLCDFRGASAYSGVTALRNRPRGAGFELASTRPFIWKILATDVEIGPDGAVWLSDWTEGWNQTGKGRLYRVVAEENASGVAAGRVRDVARILREGLGKSSNPRLATLLAHVDRRVRQEAHLELAARGAREVLAGRLGTEAPRLARLHAIWGLGILAREDPRALSAFGPLLRDFDEEVRAQAAKILGQSKQAARSATVRKLTKPLLELLGDRSARVRFFAAISLGQLGVRRAWPKLLQVLEENEDRDAYLRHAAVQGLFRLARGDREKYVALLSKERTSPSKARRRGAILALRLLRSDALMAFVGDNDTHVLEECARAIYDAAIAGRALRALASLCGDHRKLSDPTLRRVLAANFRLGDAQSVDRLLAFCGDASAPVARRVDTLRMLQRFERPSARDPVINLWRPMGARKAATLDDRLDANLRYLLLRGKSELRVAASELVRARRRAALRPELEKLVRDERQDGKVRQSALESLIAFGSKDASTKKLLADLAEICGRAKQGGLRAAGARALAGLDPERAAPVVAALATSAKTVQERQNATRLLGGLKADAATREVLRLFAQLEADKLDPSLALETLEAAASRPALAERLKAWNTKRKSAGVVREFVECMEGGNVRAGRRIYNRNQATTCTRCHTMNGKGGNAGPDLAKIGKMRTAAEILESLVDPHAKIVEGFGTYVFEMKSGAIHSGSAKTLKNGKLEVTSDAGSDKEKKVVIDPKDIDFKSEPSSAMPGVRGILTKRQIRDLIAFLKSKK